MADAKAGGGLNGAFYGPTVPPPSAPPRHTSRSVGRGVGSCCCGCLLCTLFKIVAFIVFVLGVIVLVLWLVFRPNHLKVYVDDATLSRFDLNSNSSGLLSYDLSLDVSIRNPNRRVALYYDYIEAAAIYDGYRFAYDNSLPVFFQDHKNTTVIYPKFEGQKAMAVSLIQETYTREQEEGWFYVEVKIYARVRFKVWFVKTNKYKPKATCELKLPVPGSGSGSFSRTKCDVDHF